MELEQLDLNLLKTLLVLLQEKSTSKAADRLDTSQPAVSRALAKLRIQLNDPLFFRESRGLKLSPKAEELAVRLPLIFENLADMLSTAEFLPHLLTGKLRIAMNGFVIETHGYKICSAIKQVAPNLEIELHCYGSESTSELINGKLDFAISYYPLALSKELRQVPVGRFRFAAIVRKQHNLAGQKLSLEQALAYELAGLIVPEFNNKGMAVFNYVEPAIELKPKFRSQALNPILNAVKESNLLFVAPQSLLDMIDKNQYALVEVSDEQARNEVKIGLIYNTKYMGSQKFQWLESICKQILPGNI